MKPSKIRRKAAYDAAVALCYAKKAADYEEELNPFKKETAQHSIFEKEYRKCQERYFAGEALFEENRLVYGDF